MTPGHNDVIVPASPRSARVAALLSWSLRRLVDSWSPSGYQLRVIRGLVDCFGVLRSPLGTRTWPDRCGGVRGLWVRGTGVERSSGILLYLHGGGFVSGSPRSHFGLAKRLSSAGGLAVFLADYRRAPESTFPAAADDALDAYRGLLARGVDPTRIAVGGDSAGGHLAASLLADVKRHGLPMPAAALLISPVLDANVTEAIRRDRLTRDPVISPAYGIKCARAYLGGNLPTHPRVAVLDSDLHGWPPVLIQAGDTECLLGDSERLAEALTAAGTACELQVWPGQVHVFQALARYLPEARTAIGYAGGFLRDNLTIPSRHR